MIINLFKLALKNLKSRGIRSWLTLLGILIGVTAVVSLVSLGSGLQAAVATQFGANSNQLITIQAGGVSGFGPPGSFVVDPLTKDDSESIERLSSVENAVTRYIESAKIEYSDVISFKFVGSLPDNKEDIDLLYTQLDLEPLKGRLLKSSDLGKIVVGYNLYNNIEEWDGKQITIGKSLNIDGKSFEVVGITKKKGSLILDNVIIMPEKDMQNLFNLNDDVNIIVAKPRNEKEIDKTKEDIEKLLRSRRNVDLGEEDFEVSTPEATLETIKSVINGVQIFVVIVASISIFIGVVGIINTMATSVTERKKEIGIAKSIGARNEHIFLQFFIESSLLGLIGGILGVILGTLLGFVGIEVINNFLGTELKLSFDFILIFFSLLGSFIIGGIAGILPAINAAKQNPVDVLR